MAGYLDAGHRPALLRSTRNAVWFLGAALAVAAPGAVSAQECSDGLCGTPEQSGGGGGGGGGSILIAMTDRGETYQFADDYDADGFEDQFDNCPFSHNIAQLDADGDGAGDSCDLCPSVADPLQHDLDGDSLGDACDDDVDGDDILDAVDNCRLMPNAAQVNTDDDAEGDACDDDDDGDGIPDLSDTCRLLRNDPNTGELLGSGDCDDDADGDGIPGALDNCPFGHNADQIDFDNDGAGDVCDLDLDGDEIPNFADNCPGTFNPSQIDLDRDGRGDAGAFDLTGESCDSRECYVVGGQEDACLDPNAPFRVALGVVREVELDRLVTGELVDLTLFTNRLRELHSWEATFERVPPESNASLVNRTGAGTTVSGTPQVANCLRLDGEGNCEELNTLRFIPDAAGTYIIAVTVELAGDDDLGSRVATTRLALEAEGAPTTQPGSGCSSAGTSSIGFLPLLGLALFLRRRRSR